MSIRFLRERPSRIEFPDHQHITGPQGIHQFGPQRADGPRAARGFCVDLRAPRFLRASSCRLSVWSLVLTRAGPTFTVLSCPVHYTHLQQIT